MSNAKSGGELSRIRSTDGCVSFSLNDSWTGKKSFELINQDHNLNVTSKCFHVRKIIKYTCTHERTHIHARGCMRSRKI